MSHKLDMKFCKSCILNATFGYETLGAQTIDLQRVLMFCTQAFRSRLNCNVSYTNYVMPGLHLQRNRH